MKVCPQCSNEAADVVRICICGYKFTETDRPIPPSLPEVQGSDINLWGWLLVVAGLAASGGSLLLDTTAGAYDPVHNRGLMQFQMMLFQFGLALFVAGVATILAGAIVTRLK